MKKEIITICGGLGSGKSSTADMIAKELGYTRFSSGDFFRQIGIDLGLSVNELNIKAENDTKIDFLVDEKLRNMRDSNKVVIDSRTAFHWIPESFKIYLEISKDIAKNRILNNLTHNQMRRDSEANTNTENIYEKMEERFTSEQKRYWDLYKIDNTKKDQFDLVINTNKNNLKQVVDIILREYNLWLTK